MPAAQQNAFSAEPNVTPMIDVLLVMLIVFMVAMIRVRHTIDTQLPQPCGASCEATTPIVLEVLPSTRYRINQADVPSPALLGRLRAIYAPRPDKILEVAGHRGVRYDEVIHAMDIAKSAGVAVITVAPKASQ